MALSLVQEKFQTLRPITSCDIIRMRGSVPKGKHSKRHGFSTQKSDQSPTIGATNYLVQVTADLKSVDSDYFIQ